MRLIDADDMEYLEELEYEYHPESNGEPWYRAKDVWDCIEKEHTVDPASLRPKGGWEKHPHAYGFVRCSVCQDCNVWGEWVDGKKWNFCPNCGADMRGGA